MSLTQVSGNMITSNTTFSNIVASNGLYSVGNYNGSFSDGIVVDYVTGNGRISVGSADALTFYNGGVASSALMTLDASGNVGLGSTSPANFGSGSKGLTINGTGNYQNIAWQVNGTSIALAYTNGTGGGFLIGTEVSTPLIFTTAGTERGRIDSSGNFLVGTTSVVGSARFSVAADTTIQNPMALSNTRSTAATDYSLLLYRAGNIVGSIQTSLTATTYVTSSDQRLKTNVTPAGSAIQSILDFPVDQFDWISTGEHQDFGAVAQKAINVIPEMVSVPADEDEMWGIDWSKAVPRLIKTIQELSIELNELKQKVK